MLGSSESGRCISAEAAQVAVGEEGPEATVTVTWNYLRRISSYGSFRLGNHSRELIAPTFKTCSFCPASGEGRRKLYIATTLDLPARSLASL